MSTNWPKAGPNHLPSYQISGIPFVTSSAAGEVPGPDSDSVSAPVKVKFPFVTNFLTIHNTGRNGLRVGFSQDGVIAPGERRATVDADKVGIDRSTAGSGSYGGRNYFLIPTGSANTGFGDCIQTFNVRCKEVYFLSNAGENSTPTSAGLSTDFSIFAGLTTIDSGVFPLLTGSNGFPGVG
jgi:hypothetical protein